MMLNVVYLSTTGNTVELSGVGNSFIHRDGGNLVGSFILGYSTQTTCSSWSNPVCDRPNFDLVGFYFIQALVSDGDIALLLQVIATGSQILFDRTATCQCNTGSVAAVEAIASRALQVRTKAKSGPGSCIIEGQRRFLWNVFIFIFCSF